MTSTPPDRTPAWLALGAHAERMRDSHLAHLAQDPVRMAAFAAEAPGVRLEFFRQRMVEETLGLLLDLARQRDVEGWRNRMLGGGPVNTTENRAALHTMLRAGSSAPMEVQTALATMRSLAGSIRRGERTGATGRPFRRIIHLGTGGSDLGPRLIVDALSESCDATLELRFVANVDPLDLERALSGADAETTLFIAVSKTFSTQETVENARAARDWLRSRLGGQYSVDRHFIAVTSNEVTARRFGVSEVLPTWDWVGGRFSLWSAVGLSAMCMIGEQQFDELLSGARDIDAHFADSPLHRNLPVLMALIGVWNTNFLGAGTHAVLPYSTALRLLPQHLQQLEMESNGKSVDRDGNAVAFATAPITWGMEGTVGQHSFHQLLHQGTHCVPSDFIVFKDAPGDPRRRRMLAANAEAQATALAMGRNDASLPPYRRYPGNKPSSTLHIDRLDARHLGRLIALYEHKVFVQGVIWNVNSFDQWGVEFGKELAAQFLART